MSLLTLGTSQPLHHPPHGRLAPDKVEFHINI